MEQLVIQLDEAVKKADEVLAYSISNWRKLITEYPSNERVLFLSSQSVEMAHIYSYMTRAVSGICTYVTGGNQELASSNLYDIFQEIDNSHTETPNERSKVSYEVIFGAMSAVKEDNLEDARKYLGTMAQIADMTRLSILEHMEALEQLVDESGLH
ncbi:hypothetical protein [Halalkalibacter urbisdiaboli]|uniref:hypothetical protein n=1 Tax=Halalkalibacter urbisdiaboli TaxID=1960589 RepID=UPI000B43924C|nr:hypothetical protein [Halalkalibacter urbisdiaboli]